MQRRAADEAVLGCSCRAETSYIKWASGRLNRPCNASGVMWTRLEGGPHHLVRSFPYQYLMFQTILLYFAAVGRPKGGWHLTTISSSLISLQPPDREENEADACI